MNAIVWGKRILIGAAGVTGIALLSGASYEGLMRYRTARRFPAPGVMVDVGRGRRLQLDCRGAGSPTVVLEAGLDNFGSLAWSAVHDSLARTTRACAYSRPGVMWSDPADAPFDAAGLARDLHRALVSSGESAPWVMVGHSIGGPYVITFTKVFDAEVAGVVLVDPSHPDQFARFAAVTGKSLVPDPAQVRLGARLAWTGLVRLLPAEAQPADWPAVMTQIPPAFLSVSLSGLAREVEAIPVMMAASSSFRSLGRRPLVVLSAMKGQSAAQLAAMKLTSALGDSLREVTWELHEEMAGWSTRGRHELVAGASHYIHFDRPAAVIRAVRDVVAEVRAVAR
jgi:pimeloyl-ACP methyl ester carboxylesterase